MRLLTVGTLALALLGAGAIYYTFFRLADANIAALVPEDMRYGVFYRSLDELREAYEHPYARQDLDPARRRVGSVVNVPGLDGVAYHRAVGSYVGKDGEEVFLVPFRDFDAFDRAFEKGQDNLHLRAPKKVARGYLGLSRTGRLPGKSPDHRLVLRGLEHPIALVGYPDDATTLKRMLVNLLAPDARVRGVKIRSLAEVAMRMPDAVAAAAAKALDDVVVGIDVPQDKKAPVRAVIDAKPAAGGPLSVGPPDGARSELRRVMACLPVKSTMFAAAALSGDAWKRAGLPIDLGDATVAVAVVDEKPRAGRYQLLAVVRTARGEEMLDRLDALAPVLFAAELAEKPTYETVKDGDTPVRVAVLSKRPPALERFLRSGRRKPRPVYFASAREGGFWFGAIGTYAEAAVRAALACRRGAEELSVLRGGLLAHHKEALVPRGVGVAVVTPQGLKAFDLPMPYFGVVSLAQPHAVSALLTLGDRAHLDIRVVRQAPDGSR